MILIFFQSIPRFYKSKKTLHVSQVKRRRFQGLTVFGVEKKVSMSELFNITP